LLGEGTEQLGDRTVCRELELLGGSMEFVGDIGCTFVVSVSIH